MFVLVIVLCKERKKKYVKSWNLVKLTNLSLHICLLLLFGFICLPRRALMGEFNAPINHGSVLQLLIPMTVKNRTQN